jgi:hypothetical protein
VLSIVVFRSSARICHVVLLAETAFRRSNRCSSRKRYESCSSDLVCRSSHLTPLLNAHTQATIHELQRQLTVDPLGPLEDEAGTEKKAADGKGQGQGSAAADEAAASEATAAALAAATATAAGSTSAALAALERQTLSRDLPLGADPSAGAAGAAGLAAGAGADVPPASGAELSVDELRERNRWLEHKASL